MMRLSEHQIERFLLEVLREHYAGPGRAGRLRAVDPVAMAWLRQCYTNEAFFVPFVKHYGKRGWRRPARLNLLRRLRHMKAFAR